MLADIILVRDLLAGRVISVVWAGAVVILLAAGLMHLLRRQAAGRRRRRQLSPRGAAIARWLVAAVLVLLGFAIYRSNGVDGVQFGETACTLYSGWCEDRVAYKDVSEIRSEVVRSGRTKRRLARVTYRLTIQVGDQQYKISAHTYHENAVSQLRTIANELSARTGPPWADWESKG